METFGDEIKDTARKIKSEIKDTAREIKGKMTEQGEIIKEHANNLKHKL
ncbi:hypothetical protein [uncultured Clostridium sp.]|nr:hypothetical protein [uncultured Clostridium sp.]